MSFLDRAQTSKIYAGFFFLKMLIFGEYGGSSIS